MNNPHFDFTRTFVLQYFQARTEEAELAAWTENGPAPDWVLLAGEQR